MSSLQNIRNNFTRGIECRLLNDRYFDYMLHKGGVEPISSKEECLSAWIDLNKEESRLPYDGIVSLTEWENAKASDFTLKHIGFTGIDNGFIQYDKDEISQNDFNDIFIGSEMVFTNEDTTLALYPVTGNTKKYSYKYEFAKDDEYSYAKLNGGFFQGVFKVPEEEYEVLPPYIDEDWHFEFVIRPKSLYSESGVTLNSEHENNKGIFFFIGARAENKFAVMSDEEKIIEYEGKKIDITEGIDDIEVRTDNKHIFYNRTSTGSTVHKPTGVDEEGFRTIIKKKTREYKDNAFKLFDRTKDGYTASDVKNGNAEDIYADSGDTYDIMKDIIGNAFALKYNDDGSVSYRYTMKDCEAENGWSLQEETTKPNLVKDGEWNVINVRFAILDHAKDPCGVPLNLGNRRMKILIYINGYLVLVSRELNEFRFRPLMVKSKFQECVPFNISFGGGTQGLAEMITPDYKKLPEFSYYLENTYAGTFIGDVRAFKMYTCFMQYEEIKNNYILEIGKNKPEGCVIPSEKIKESEEDKNNVRPIPDIIKPEEDEGAVKRDKIYYGFGKDPEYVLVNGKQIDTNCAYRIKYLSTSQVEDAHFYVIMSKKYTGTWPFQFTCGGAPMVMEEKEMTVSGTECIVYESGAIYPYGTELLILSDNI